MKRRICRQNHLKPINQRPQIITRELYPVVFRAQELRIGCVADYPVELRQQALEFVNLSPRSPYTPSPFLSPRAPRTPTTPSAYRRPGGLAPTTSQLTSKDSNADGTSAAECNIPLVHL
ncbi:hypothetical protein CRYUN_Cryun08bG0128700 [Craigia yunnanensis]